MTPGDKADLERRTTHTAPTCSCHTRRDRSHSSWRLDLIVKVLLQNTPALLSISPVHAILCAAGSNSGSGPACPTSKRMEPCEPTICEDRFWRPRRLRCVGIRTSLRLFLPACILYKRYLWLSPEAAGGQVKTSPAHAAAAAPMLHHSNRQDVTAKAQSPPSICILHCAMLGFARHAFGTMSPLAPSGSPQRGRWDTLRQGESGRQAVTGTMAHSLARLVLPPCQPPKEVNGRALLTSDCTGCMEARVARGPEQCLAENPSSAVL